jgi:GTPase
LKEVFGNTSGLKASVLKRAQLIYGRRVPPNEVITLELATTLCQLSREISRQIGVFIDRRGQIDHVILGDAKRLWLPDVGRLRGGRGRLRGLRLIHTHLRDETLSNDDLTDLALLKLDLVMAMTITADGYPAIAHGAHLLPENPNGDLWQLLDKVPVHKLRLDILELVRSLEDEFARASRAQDVDRGKEQAILVHVKTRGTRRAVESSIGELKELCRTAGVAVLDKVVQRRDRPDPKFALGKGKLEDTLLRANQLGAELLIFDPDLSPAQARAITDATDLKIIDRTMLILDIFAQRATSRDGKLQVELAQLKYTLPRLVERNTMMSRLTGGIGGRGPGETKLEVNRRRARDRIAGLEKQIRQLSEQRSRRRSLRRQRKVPVVSIVGYTNAGKSTLINGLTQSKTLVENKLFATLDPVSRRLRFPQEKELILTDTVGFIHDLPKELVNAFRATLEELAEADLFLHIIDVSDPAYEKNADAVRAILSDLDLGETPTLTVFNKMDRLDTETLASRMKGFDALPISALDRKTTKRLLAAMERELWREDKMEIEDYPTS